MDKTIETLQHALTPANWHDANRQLVCKILCEFLYEEMLTTTVTELQPKIYQHTLIISDNLSYQFTAEPRIFGNWHINSVSITRSENNTLCLSLSVSQFILDTYQLIGIDGLTLGHLLRELNHTLVADCHLYSQKKIFSKDLLKLPNHLLEGCMHGHPWFVINKGRLGFSYADYLQFAPEVSPSMQLAWIAVKKSYAIFNASFALNYDDLIAEELSLAEQQQFISTLHKLNVCATDYYFMPIHEWQWQHQLIHLFAEDLVKQDMIYLGMGRDSYLPTQSIRTFTNQSNTKKYQVKLPLSIFNTAVYRGLPGERTQLAPLLTEWLQQKYASDNFLQTKCRLVLLGEIASIDYPQRHYNDLPGVPYQYKELLGVIWRENVNSYLNENETAITMAALIHIDMDQQPFVCQLIEKSGLTTADWLNEFFTAVIPPLLHWLYRYGLVFSPHGENTLLILKNSRPVGLVLKDFIDDVNLSQTHLPEVDDLPLSLQNTLLKVGDKDITQFIHTGLFVVLYRYLSDILETYADYSEADFWRQVHDTIQNYQAAHPALKDRFAQFDLLCESFNKMCLNRLRILSVGYADYAERPKVDTITPMKNPVHPQTFTAWANLSAGK